MSQITENDKKSEAKADDNATPSTKPETPAVKTELVDPDELEILNEMPTGLENAIPRAQIAAAMPDALSNQQRLRAMFKEYFQTYKIDDETTARG